MLEPNPLLDVLLVAVTPLLLWGTVVVGWQTPLMSLLWWVNAFVQSWMTFMCFFIYHDICVHRSAFGPWASWLAGLYVTGAGITWGSANSNWAARHFMHHKFTFEDKDPKLFRSKLRTPMARLVCLNGFIRQLWRKPHWEAYNRRMERGAAAADKDKGKDKDKDRSEPAVDVREHLPERFRHGFYARRGFEQVIHLTMGIAWGVALWHYPVEASRSVMGVLVFSGLWDSLRFIMEHADQDNDNPFSHSTLYKTNLLTQVLTFWDGGDCHAAHHLYPRAPLYRLGRLGNALVPVLVRNGVRLHDSLIELCWNYLIVGRPHGTRWPAAADSVRKRS
ncbi:unnamed protein product [Chrysoparadoxa australica]